MIMSYDNRITFDSLLEENKLLRLQIKYLIDILTKFSSEVRSEKEKEIDSTEEN